MRDFINDWDWPHVANVQLVIRGSSASPATWKGDGTLKMERGRFRTVGFNSASTHIRFGEGAVSYEDFRAFIETRSAEVVANILISLIHQANYLLWVAHNLERAADRVTNLCERTLFTVTGEMVEFDTEPSQ